MSRVVLEDGRVRDVPPVAAFYFPSEAAALSSLTRHFPSVYKGRTPLDFGAYNGYGAYYGGLWYKEMQTVGIFRKREKEVKHYDDTISLQPFGDKGEVMLNIKVVDFNRNELYKGNLDLVLAIEKEIVLRKV